MRDNMNNTTCGTKEIYYADLLLPAEVFANEWDKRILLNTLESVRKLFDFELYAFCVLNNRVLLLAGGLKLKASVIRRMLATLMERYECRIEQIGESVTIPPEESAKVCIIRIEGEHEAANVLRYIHLMPSSEGYALSAWDYWWTSLSSYRGNYYWPMVDAEVVMRALGRRDRQAARSLLEYHRKAECMHNPSPECIRNGRYHLLDWRNEDAPQGISEENLNETFSA